MMKHLQILLFLAALTLGASETDLLIAVNRKDITPAENTAAGELRHFLQKITGRNVAVRDESELKNGADIYLGRTAFARAHAPAPDTFGREEWYVKAQDTSVIIAGGRPRGVIYGVYEYLEKEFGVLFIACDQTEIPARPFQVRKNLLLTGKPFMEFRSIQWGGPGPVHGDYAAFLSRTRNNHFTRPEYGGPWRFGSPGWCHTFHAYSRNFPEDKMEYFSLRNGKRLRSVSDAGPGQLCTSHPEVRELVWKNLQDFIAADRKKYPDDPPDIYILDRNDNNMYCECERCRKFVREHGNLTDLHLDFINDIASRLKSVHPELRLMTMAYTYTLTPPQKIRPLDNIIIQIANLGKEFTGGQTETMHPIQSARNTGFRKLFGEWKKIAKNIYIWDYWILYGKGYHYPCFNLSRYVSDFRFFAENNVHGILVETQYQRSPFYAFRGWLAGRLAVNPFLDQRQQRDLFFDAYYGPGAEKLKEYLSLLQRALENEEKSIALTIPSQLGYLNREFLDRADQLLDEAERRSAGRRRNLENIRIERICVDTARLKLKLGGGREEREWYVKRLLENLDLLATRYGYRSHPRYRKELRDAKTMAETFRFDIALPSGFEGKNVCDFLWIDMPQRRLKQITATDDPSACGGRAIRMGGTHRLPFITGIYDGNIRKRGPELSMHEFPQDEKYHLYRIGTYDVRNNVALHALPSSDFWMPLDRAYPNSPENICDIYASFKFTGPLYVKDSKLENAVWIDRILVVRK